MYPHRIRLRGPWEFEPLCRLIEEADGTRRYTTSGLPEPRRLSLPCRWGDSGLSGFAGKARMRRRFGLPRRIDEDERVWLTFVGADGVVEVWLNGKLLGQRLCGCGMATPFHLPTPAKATPEGGHTTGTPSFEFQVKELLHERNELIVEVESEDDSGGLCVEAALEIRCLAFLRGVCAWVEPSSDRIIVEGLVVGTSDYSGSPASFSLEVYVILGRSTIAYGTVSASEKGQPFRLMSDELENPAAGEVLVQLVSGATVWYESVCEIAAKQVSGE